MLLLYEHPLSSYAQKVKIALREKGVDFKAELPGDFGTGRTDGPFAAINPRVEVPVLIDGPMQIFNSTVIMEYIEERWPEPPLLPREPAARAFARITEDVCDTQYEAVNWGFGEVLWFRRATGALADMRKAHDLHVTGRQIVLYALALVPVSLLPTQFHLAGRIYFAAAVLMGVTFASFGALLAVSEKPPRRRDSSFSPRSCICRSCWPR